MTKTPLIAALALGFAALPTLAAAQPGPGGPGGQGGPRAHMEKMFDETDTDDDGKISKSEAEAAGKVRFGRIDSNDDGYATPEEVKAMAAERAQQRTEAHADRMVSHLDTDGDGKISAPEFAAGGEKRFSKMDANGDGYIEKGEPRQAFQQMKKDRGAKN